MWIVAALGLIVIVFVTMGLLDAVIEALPTRPPAREERSDD